MLNKKLLSIFIAIAMMFALAGVASAGNGTEDEPYTILYIGTEGYCTFPFGGAGSMGNNNVVNGTYVSTNPSNNYYFDVQFQNGYDASWSNPDPELWNMANNSEFQNYDVVIVDMVNMYQGSFATAYADANAAGTKLISFRTGSDDNNVDMPPTFSWMDVYSYTVGHSVPYLTNNDNCVDFVEGTDAIYGPINANWGNADASECAAWLDVLGDYVS